MFERLSVQETLDHLETDGERGLGGKEAARRLQRNGRNEMKHARVKTLPERFVEQLNDPLIYVLIAAAVISLSLGEINDAVIIGVVVTLNAVVGLVQEGKARKALESLKKLTAPRAVVVRDGQREEIDAAELVAGDLVCLEAGCQVPADIRLVESRNLMVEESSLTGESLPIEKDAAFLVSASGNAPLGDRHNMAYMSTIVTNGRGMGIVTETGMNTEIGKIAAMITEHEEELTPLQKRLGELGKVLSLLSLGLCAALFIIALWQKRNVLEMLVTAISLAVAAVPEGLPAVVTICLALSVTRMVKVNTIIRRLPSVETLGAVSVVCSDKTGTLTQNRMSVEKYWTTGSLEELLQGMALCNDASIEGDKRMGDPTELALLDLAEKHGLHKAQLERNMPRQGELPFDSDRKMMTTCHLRGDGMGYVSYTKGAPDAVLKRCTQILMQGRPVRLTEARREQILDEVRRMSGEALRTLALAMRENGRIPAEEQLIFVGMVGMKDPARPEAAAAVETFKEAGVSTVMITGDHVDTAFAIGRQLGIVQEREQCMTGEELQGISEEDLGERLETVRVFARVSPAQKVQIVRGFKKQGKIVAMTGDGVNDAPSLKIADIGIAMGKTGTDVAKQASDMILVDDDFATIEKAIEEGRGVYENIRKSVIFLLSSNLGEIITMFFAVLCGLASPLKSSHILWINLITDSLPALALGIDKNDGRSLMQHSPRRPEESLFARGGFLCTCFYGGLIALASLTAFLLLPLALLRSQGAALTLENLSEVLGQGTVLQKSQTYAFTVLGMSQLFHAVGMRDVHRSVFAMNHLENKLMLAACAVGVCLQLAVTEVPILISAFTTSHLSGREWMLLSLLAAAPMLAHECIVLLEFIWRFWKAPN